MMPCDTTAAAPVPILVVEDNDDDVLLIREAFAEVGLRCDPRVARDATEALDYLRGRGRWSAAKAPPPAIVLLDIHLPGRSGIFVLDEMQADPALRRIPVVMLTGSQRSGDKFEAYRGGATLYVTKPSRYDEFRDTVRLLGRLALLVQDRRTREA